MPPTTWVRLPLPRVGPGTSSASSSSVGSTKILVVVTTDDDEIAHKAVDLGAEADRRALDEGARYLSETFAGLPLWDVRTAVIEQLRQERMLYDQLRSRALRLASLTLEEMVPPNHLFVEGAWFLAEEVSDGEDRVPLQLLRTLLAMIERKDLLVRVRTNISTGPGLTVVIGTENSSPEMQASAWWPLHLLATAPARGRIGIIGPRRNALFAGDRGGSRCLRAP